MRFGSGLATFAQLVVVASLSAAGVLTLAACSLYSPAVSLVSRLYPISPLHFGLVLIGLFTLLGVSLVLAGMPDRFMWLVVTLSLPSLYAYSYFKWFRFLGLDFRIETQLDFVQMLALGLFLPAGYLVLLFMNRFKASRRDLLGRGGAEGEVGPAYSRQHLWAVAAISGAALAAGAVVLLAIYLSLAVQDYFGGLPLMVITLGVGCSVAIIAAVYTVLARRRAA
jgi:hypothetical protein